MSSLMKIESLVGAKLATWLAVVPGNAVLFLTQGVQSKECHLTSGRLEKLVEEWNGGKNAD